MIEQLQTEKINQGFIAELVAVEDLLTASLSRIYSPLSILVRSQIALASPHKRAAVILAAAFPGENNDGLDRNELKAKRIYLAAALEMLYIALQVHQLLLNNRIEKMEDTIDKSVLGSTILAGDYCFSHAASLAAQTDSPAVVAIFSEVLQSISEYQLRSLFAADSRNAEINQSDTLENLRFDPSIELCKAGIRAASHLVQLPVDSYNCYATIVEEIFALEITGGDIPNSETSAEETFVQELHSLTQTQLARVTLSSAQQSQWSALFTWLTQATQDFQTKR